MILPGFLLVLQVDARLGNVWLILISYSFLHFLILFHKISIDLILNFPNFKWYIRFWPKSPILFLLFSCSRDRSVLFNSSCSLRILEFFQTIKIQTTRENKGRLIITVHPGTICRELRYWGRKWRHCWKSLCYRASWWYHKSLSELRWASPKKRKGRGRQQHPLYPLAPNHIHLIQRIRICSKEPDLSKRSKIIPKEEENKWKLPEEMERYVSINYLQNIF